MEFQNVNQNDREAAKDKQAKQDEKYNREAKIESWGWTNNVDPSENNKQ